MTKIRLELQAENEQEVEMLRLLRENMDLCKQLLNQGGLSNMKKLRKMDATALNITFNMMAIQNELGIYPGREPADPYYHGEGI